MSPAKRLEDEDHREKIVQDLETNCLVEAAAGTGKTTSMVSRMVELLARGKCSPDSLAAVTFTRKAAAELRERFQLELERRTAEVSAGTCPAEEGPHLQAALEQVDRCFIGTIHSFCATLLRERPVEAGVDMGFRELEETEDTALRRRAWETFVAGLYADADNLLDELAACRLQPSDLTESFLAFAEYPDVEEWPHEHVEFTDGEITDAREKLKEYLARLDALEPSLPDDAGNDTLMPKIRKVVVAYRTADLDDRADLLDFLLPFTPISKIVQRNWPGKKEQALAQKEEWNDFSESVALPLLRKWRNRRYGVVLRVFGAAREVYDKIRMAAGALNFQDLLMKTARCLADHAETRAYFQQRFKRILVDEFQDTDPVQAEVLLLLTADDPGETVWRRCCPRAGSLFVVGDPKQSIYRFRRADIVTYNQVKSIIEQNGEVLKLTSNFRSDESITGWVNGIFAPRFPGEANDYAPAYDPLASVRQTELTGNLEGVFHLQATQGITKQDPLAEEDAGRLAAYIQARLDDGSTVPRTAAERAGGIPAELRASDIMIITRNTHRMDTYARKLRELGIPHEVTGGGGLGACLDIELLSLVMQAVNDPDNPLPLVAVLRSEVFGISDPALYRFKRAGGRFNFRSAVPGDLDPADQGMFADAFERLRRYAGWMRTLPPVVAIGKTSGDLGLTARASLSADGAQHAGSLMKCFELMRAAAESAPSPSEVVEYLRVLAAGEESHDTLPARPPEERGVRIMNLHKAKGLEAPVVFLADPSGESKHPVSLHVDRSSDRTRGYMAVYAKKAGHQRPLLARPMDWDTHCQEEEKFEKAEKDRLRYVAATRAGSMVVVSHRHKPAPVNPWNDLVADVPLGNVPEPAPGELPVNNPEMDDDVSAMETNLAGRWQHASNQTYAIRAVKEFAVSGGTGAAVLHRRHGAEIGSVIHLLLEAAMAQPHADLSSLARGALSEYGLDPALAAEALKTVTQVMKSEIWQRASNSGRTLVEMPFEVGVSADSPWAEGLPTLVRGVIDLAFEEQDGWVIVDYKSESPRDDAGLDELVEHYRGQLDIYADFWKEKLGLTVKEKGLYFTACQSYRPC